MLDLGHMAKLNVDTLSKKNYKKKTKGVANEQRMVIFIMKIDGPHLVEVQVHMEHVVEKGKKEEMTTHWSEHKVKESNILLFPECRSVTVPLNRSFICATVLG